LHARIVTALETLSGEQIAEQVERLAHHAFRGEVWDKVLLYCRQAGAQTAARSAYREAVGYLEQALDGLQHLPESRGLLTQAIDLRLDLRNALLSLGELGRIFEHLRAAERLAVALDDTLRLGQICAYLAQCCRQQGEHGQALRFGRRALALVESSGDHTQQIAITHFLCFAYHAMGDYRNSITCAQRNLASLQGAQRYERCGLTGIPSVFACGFMAWCLAGLGAFAEAIAYGEEGVHIAQTVDQPWILMSSYNALGEAYLGQGDVQQAIPWHERAVGICQNEHLPGLFPGVATNLGHAYALAGRVAESLQILEQAVERAASLRIVGYQSQRLTRLGETYLQAGRLDDASTCAAQTLELARTHGERGHEAYTRRLLGDLARQRHPQEIEQAETCYQHALSLATELGMRPLQAHCHRGLGTLYSQNGQSEHARAALSMAVEMYREMEMTFWLPETKAALAAVAKR
jgi:tetratricopeptide (TPR) repeat protein